jgi:quercetin dioxygenase-like cupin family protein
MKPGKTKMSLLGTFIGAVFLSVSATAQVTNEVKVDKGSPAYFTGNVWVKALATDTTKHWSIAEVTFEKGTRSNWHYHPDKQVLIITEGIGYLKEQGKPVQTLRKGDVVTIQPGVLHWHGATPEKAFTQIVVNPNIEKGVVTWLQKVTEEEYRSGK